MKLPTACGVLLAALILAAPPIVLADGYDDFAAKARETLAGAGSITLESVMTMEMPGLKVPLRMSYRALAPGYAWMKSDNLLMNLEILVGDSTTTVIHPALRKYSCRESLPSAPAEPSGGLPGMQPPTVTYGMVTAALTPMERRFPAVFAGHDTLDVGGQRRACAVFDVAMDTTFVNDSGSLIEPVAKYWLGLSDGLLYKSLISATRKAHDVETPIAFEIAVASLDLDAGLTPADFVFTPPAGYVREDVMSKLLVERSLAGAVAPDVALTGLDGAAVRLDDLRGEIVIVDFWATWCAPCRKELAELKEAIASGALDVRVLIVSAEARDVVAGYVTEQALPMWPLLDRDGSAVEAFGVENWPTLFVIDAGGTIREHHVGYTSPSLLITAVQALRTE